MDNYYRKYFILKSHVNRGKSAILKAEKKNGYVKIKLSFEGNEIRENLYLLGFDNTGKSVFKVKATSTFEVKSDDLDLAKYLAIILEKKNACSLEYLEKEKEKAILSCFEKYRFYSFSSGILAKKNKETVRVFEKSSAREVKEKDKTTGPNNRQYSNANSNESGSQGDPKSNDSMPNLFSSFQQASQLFSTMNAANAIKPKNAPIDDTPQKQPTHNKINPFMNYFPNSEWIKTQYQGQRGYWHYLSGKIYDGQTLKYKAIAVPGEYSVSPPSWLEGFNKYYVSNIPTASGYWIMFLDPETGKTIDPPD